MNLSLAFAPLLSPVLLALAGLAAALLVAVSVWRRQRGALLRAGVLLLVFAALFKPSVVAESRLPLPGIVAVVADHSASQGLAERAADTDRAAAAIAASLARQPNIEVRPVRYDGNGSGGTELFAAAGRALSDVPPERVSGVVLVTDGQVHDVPANAASLGFAAPVHALITGDTAEFDRRVTVVSAPKFGLVKSRQTLTIRLDDDGAAPPRHPVPVTIRRDGETVDSRFASPGETLTVDVEIAHAGENIFEIETPAVPGELSPVNNAAVVIVDGIRQALKVLLVSGEPHPGERTWRNLLKSDAAVDLIHFTILRPPEKQDGTPINELSLIAFPTRELFDEKINDFDLIIFDRYQKRGVLPLIYFDNIARFVAGGGGLLIAAGPDQGGDDSVYDSPLGPVLPLAPTGQTVETPFKPLPSDLGRRHPVTRDLDGIDGPAPAWGRWFRLIEADAVRGDTLLTGPGGGPLLTLARQGKGRVAMLMSDQVWLWARGFEGGGPYVELLRNLAHWLMKEPDLEEEALRLKAAPGALVVERQSLGTSAAPVTVSYPDGTRSQPIELKQEAPGRFAVRLPAPTPGLYKATDGEHVAIAHVGPTDAREFSALISTAAVLQPIADATAGSVTRLHPTPGSALTVPDVIVQSRSSHHAGNGWIGVKATDAHEVTGVERVDLFVGLIGMAMLLAALGGLWWREGR